jgi:uncharacterized protein (DUF952 family)
MPIIGQVSMADTASVRATGEADPGSAQRSAASPGPTSGARREGDASRRGAERTGGTAAPPTGTVAAVTILHFCPIADWRRAQVFDEYIADTLVTEGFIHCSRPDQVHKPALLMRGRTDLVLLEIDEARLPGPVRYEPGETADPRSERFPHVYGPIPLTAIVAVHDFPPNADGTFSLPARVQRRA